jgi:hypothetical protein
LLSVGQLEVGANLSEFTYPTLEIAFCHMANIPVFKWATFAGLKE